jgi:8-oxo-dGTP pyrophosphatase MutT (NUDIX family)
MYKVFFNDRTIYLDDELPDMSIAGEDYVCAFENITDLRPQINQFLEPGKQGDLYIFHDNKDDLLNTFGMCFKNINASGGLVKNNGGELLVIKRHGLWDLPKGKSEKGETSEETALREVQEECGLHGIVVKELLASTYHIYKQNDQFVLKKTDWFNMVYSGHEIPSPAIAEDITEVRWIKTTALEEVLANTYSSINELIKEFVKS